MTGVDKDTWIHAIEMSKYQTNKQKMMHMKKKKKNGARMMTLGHDDRSGIVEPYRFTFVRPPVAVIAPGSEGGVLARP